MESLKGQLLVASADLADPNFRRAVVLVTEHDDEGALGVILNRPAETTVAEAVPPLAELVEDEEPVYVGGPVDQGSVIVLAQFEDPDEAAATIFEDVGFVSGDADLDELPEAIRQARVFAGYAGWSAGQLDAESRRTAGSSNRRSPTTCSVPPTSSGATCSGARAGPTRCSPRCRPTRR